MFKRYGTASSFLSMFGVGNTFEVDQGTQFGKWSDDVSRYMYHTSLREFLPLLKIPNNVTIGDFGGANGLLKQYLHNVTTIDIDPAKEPDVVDNILAHRKRYDIAWCRYVLHYLTDYEVLQFLDSVRADRLIIVQFVNDDLRVKYHNSRNETKYFRTLAQLEALLPVANTRRVWDKEYMVTAEFYRNRLNIDDAISHYERLVVHEVTLQQ